jgi:hypothetical protein
MTRNLLWLLRTVSRSFIRSSNYYLKKHFKIMEVDNDDALCRECMDKIRFL